MLQNFNNKIPEVKVFSNDARNLPIDDNVIDLIITSPPYVNAMDYHKMHEYSLFFLDLDFDNFRKREIGAHSRFPQNRFMLLAQYIIDMQKVLIEANRVLKKNKHLVIVVADTKIENETIYSDRLFTELCEILNFEPICVYKRKIPKYRKYINSSLGKIDEENIIIFKKVSEYGNKYMDSDAISNNFAIKKLMEIEARIISNEELDRKEKKKKIEKINQAIAHLMLDLRSL